METNYSMYPGDNSSINMTMRTDRDIGTLCSAPGLGNTTACNKSALGISLSTPILMMSTGVLGNLLALLVLYTSSKEMKKTIFFPLLLGLAWTDLIGQLCTAPIAIITYANNLRWVGGQELCTYHGFVMVWFGLLTPLIACFMSLERFTALRFPYFYGRVATRPMAQYSIVGGWIVTGLMCTLPLMGFGSYEHQFPGSWCFLNFHRESALDTAYASIFGLLNIFFICVMIICNFTVVVTLIKMRKSRKVKHSPNDRKFSVITKSLLEMEIETQMAWFLCAITIVFSICWLPLNVHIMVNQITGVVDRTKDLLSVRLASINQILDPWLYILLRKAMFVRMAKRVKSYIMSRKSDAVTNKPSYHPTQGNSQSISRVQNMMVENPIYRQESAEWDSTVKLVSKPVLNDIASKEKVPKFSVNECGDSDSDVFLNFNKCDKDLKVSDKCVRKFHSCDDRRVDPPVRSIQRLNSAPTNKD